MSPIFLTGIIVVAAAVVVSSIIMAVGYFGTRHLQPKKSHRKNGPFDRRKSLMCTDGNQTALPPKEQLTHIQCKRLIAYKLAQPLGLSGRTLAPFRAGKGQADIQKLVQFSRQGSSSLVTKTN